MIVGSPKFDRRFAYSSGRRFGVDRLKVDNLLTRLINRQAEACAIFLGSLWDKEAGRINIFIFRNVRVLFANEVKFLSYFLCVYFKFEFKIEIEFLHLPFFFLF